MDMGPVTCFVLKRFRNKSHKVTFLPEVLSYNLFAQIIIIKNLHHVPILKHDFELPSTAFLVSNFHLDVMISHDFVDVIEVVNEGNK